MICSGFPLPERGSTRCPTESPFVGNERRPFFVAGFAEIVRAGAFERDEAKADPLCAEIERGDGDRIELNEGCGGFLEWPRHFDSLPGIDPDWRGEVMRPPFARNESLPFTHRRPG